MNEQIIETWFINNRINLFLIDNINKEGMSCTLSKRGGRTVAQQFAHMHNVRITWMEVLDKGLLRKLKKVESEKANDTKLLKRSFEESGDLIAEFFKKAIENDGKIKGFKRGLIPMMGYFISHDAHHRGNILLTLKQCGHKVDQQAQYAIWDWNKI